MYLKLEVCVYDRGKMKVVYVCIEYFRIHELQTEVDDLQEKLEIAEREMKNYSKQVY